MTHEKQAKGRKPHVEPCGNCGRRPKAHYDGIAYQYGCSCGWGGQARLRLREARLAWNDKMTRTMGEETA